jgi:hypothetical protein
MPARSTRAIVAREAIVQLSTSGLEPLELLRQVAQRVRSVVPYAGAGWLLTDTATMLHTGAVTENVPDALQLGLIDNELVARDFGKFTDIARLRRPALRLTRRHGRAARAQPALPRALRAGRVRPRAARRVPRRRRVLGRGLPGPPSRGRSLQRRRGRVPGGLE